MHANFPYKSLTPQEQEVYEKRLGRKLSPTEVMFGQLDRKQTPQAGDPWRVVVANVESAEDRDLRLAREAVEAEELANMSKAKRQLVTLEKLAAQREAEAAAEAEHEKKLAAFKPSLDHLEKLLDAVRFDESYTDQDIAELWNTKQQITTPGACPNTAKTMFEGCVVKAKAKCEVRRQEALAAREFLKVEQAKQDAAAAHFHDAWGFLVPNEDATPETAEVKRAREYLALWRTHEEEVRATGAGNNSPALQQAQLHRIKASQALSDAERAAREGVSCQSTEQSAGDAA